MVYLIRFGLLYLVHVRPPFLNPCHCRIAAIYGCLYYVYESYEDRGVIRRT